MKNKNYDVDGLLKKALKSTETPDTALVQKVKLNYIKEGALLRKPKFKNYFGTAAAVIVAVMLVTTTAFAAWHFLKPEDIAQKTEDYALSAAFESKTAININESKTSGDYIFTLLAVVSGKDITDKPYYKNGEVQLERTYAVVAIQKADGSQMTADEGTHNFFASPLVKGLKPWEVNAATLGGAYVETVTEGVMYRLVECDDITMFADRGLYFAICDSTFICNTTFKFNEQTGEIAVNPAYKGASAIFDLPLDKKLADPSKAAELLKGLKSSQDTNVDFENGGYDINWNNAKAVEWSRVPLKVDGKGYFSYEWSSDGKSDDTVGSGSISAKVTDIFTSDSMSSAIVNVMKSDEATYALRVVKSEDGTFTGMIVIAQ
ncbi:hypothetical protein LY28_01137 [Ruminiclostridium sufflavum DSM 19573]|uniref:DUF4179 domain-containing protein n=1 Tax=Ruminiclostridium sufflavum DSM 19573 TaxID=1121337 RepID=A0A318XMM4_9FIRM|nr:DUF4179 domain-containing protein [Ruminiclostridium sufflavum]PYG88781.1 hypothetical protein LY28_01137 [Ruminiclostridium sufflavum DSM 19573]